MFFSGKRIHKIDRYVRRANLANKQYIYRIGNGEDIFSAVGLPVNATLGDAILPKIVGPITEFNAEGKWIVLKDQPKEDRVVGQQIWRWREFRGRYDYEDQERIVDRIMQCYPREFVPPPSLEISVQIVAEQLRLVTELPENSEIELIKHAVNMFLEIFGQCNVTDDPEEVPIVVPTRVNWRMLPPGNDPWDRVRPAINIKTENLSNDNQYIITERQRLICSLGPDEVFVGEGGFSDYLAYVFRKKNVAVLESVVRGNAIYIFDGDWRALSQMTKKDILAGNLHRERIIHATGWPERLHQALK